MLRNNQLKIGSSLAAATAMLIGAITTPYAAERVDGRLEPGEERVEPVQVPRKPPDALWCCQAHRQSPILSLFESAPEVRALSSAGITRPHRSYDPVRLPPGPPCSSRRWRCDLRPERVSADYSDYLPNGPCPLPRWIGTSACVGCFPISRGLPRQTGGSAPMISPSRPAQASLALRPAGLLDRPRRPLSRRHAVSVLDQ